MEYSYEYFSKKKVDDIRSNSEISWILQNSFLDPRDFYQLNAIINCKTKYKELLKIYPNFQLLIDSYNNIISSKPDIEKNRIFLDVHFFNLIKFISNNFDIVFKNDSIVYDIYCVYKIYYGIAQTYKLILSKNLKEIKELNITKDERHKLFRELKYNRLFIRNNQNVVQRLLKSKEEIESLKRESTPELKDLTAIALRFAENGLYKETIDYIDSHPEWKEQRTIHYKLLIQYLIHDYNIDPNFVKFEEYYEQEMLLKNKALLTTNNADVNFLLYKMTKKESFLKTGIEKIKKSYIYFLERQNRFTNEAGLYDPHETWFLFPTLGSYLDCIECLDFKYERCT